MHPELRNFLADFAGTVGFVLVPVIVTAFLSTPYTLQYHPGEVAPPQARVLHMT
jgi:hypothetical protein